MPIVDRTESHTKVQSRRKRLQRRAHRAVGVAHKRGELVRPDACEGCGATNVLIDCHHDDYERLLDCRWLCRRCHVRTPHGCEEATV